MAAEFAALAEVNGCARHLYLPPSTCHCSLSRRSLGGGAAICVIVFITLNIFRKRLVWRNNCKVAVRVVLLVRKRGCAGGIIILWIDAF